MAKTVEEPKEKPKSTESKAVVGPRPERKPRSKDKKQ